MSVLESKASSPLSCLQSGRHRRSPKTQRLSQRSQAILWNGIFSWVSDCPKCPLLHFDSDFKLTPQSTVNSKSEKGSRSKSNASWDPERRKQHIHRAKHLIANNNSGDALKELLSLVKGVAYKVDEEECSLLIHAAEIVIRKQLQVSRQVTHKDISHAVGFVKANIRRVALSSSMAIVSDIDVNSEKEDLRNLLLTLVDVCQSIRCQNDIDVSQMTMDASITENMNTPDFDTPIIKHRFELYVAFLGILIQSAFIESGLISGNVYLNRLVSNAEQAYYLTEELTEEELFFLKPLAAYIYGRLWCETAEDEGHGIQFLINYYEKHGADFEEMMKSRKDMETHSTYFCNMRRIRQFVQKQQNSI